jgi:hypothetical protein
MSFARDRRGSPATDLERRGDRSFRERTTFARFRDRTTFAATTNEQVVIQGGEARVSIFKRLSNSYSYSGCEPSR